MLTTTTTTIPNNNATQASPFPHPRAGARDANGKWGYVADVTRVRRRMLQRYQDQFSGTSMEQQSSASLVPPLSYLPMTASDTDTVCNLPQRKGVEGKEGWDVLLKVDVDAQDANTRTKNSTRNSNRTQSSNINYTAPHMHDRADDNGAFVSKGKILCGIYTYRQMHARMVGVTETWGWRCDGFLAASMATIDDPTEPGFPATDLPHEGKEEYNNMWQKTRSILAYMYDH
jgi:hypothetical protein